MPDCTVIIRSERLADGNKIDQYRVHYRQRSLGPVEPCIQGDHTVRIETGDKQLDCELKADSGLIFWSGYLLVGVRIQSSYLPRLDPIEEIDPLSTALQPPRSSFTIRSSRVPHPGTEALYRTEKTDKWALLAEHDDQTQTVTLLDRYSAGVKRQMCRGMITDRISFHDFWDVSKRDYEVRRIAVIVEGPIYHPFRIDEQRIDHTLQMSEWAADVLGTLWEISRDTSLLRPYASTTDAWPKFLNNMMASICYVSDCPQTWRDIRIRLLICKDDPAGEFLRKVYKSPQTIIDSFEVWTSSEDASIGDYESVIYIPAFEVAALHILQHHPVWVIESDGFTLQEAKVICTESLVDACLSAYCKAIFGRDWLSYLPP